MLSSSSTRVSPWLKTQHLAPAVRRTSRRPARIRVKADFFGRASTPGTGKKPLFPGRRGIHAVGLRAVARLTPLLMVGGAYLSLRGRREDHRGAVRITTTSDQPEELALSSTELENQKVGGAIRTDLILSAEIMAIALADVADQPLAVQAAAWRVVGLRDHRRRLRRGRPDREDGRHRPAPVRRRAVARRLGPRPGQGHARWCWTCLTKIGTAAMLWVGGGIIVHGLEHFHVAADPDLGRRASPLGRRASGRRPRSTGWLAFAVGSAIVGPGGGRDHRRRPAPDPSGRRRRTEAKASGSVRAPGAPVD